MANDPTTNPMANGLAPKNRPKKPLPAPIKRAKEGTRFATAVEVQRAFFTTADKLLRNSSIAYRLNPQYQQMMRADADIEGVLRSLQVSLSALEWSVIPDDIKNPRLVKLATAVDRVFRQIPRRSDMIRSMHEAVWYGTSATNMIYAKRGGEVRVVDWMPLHPDTIAFDQFGNMAMRVGAEYSASGPSSQNMGFDSRVHIFTEEERHALVLHRVFVAAPDFNDPNSSESLYRGVGARDICWFMWLAKQEILQDAITYAERYAMGIRIGYYPLGQDTGRQMMENVLANLTNDNSVLLPQSGTEKIYDIDIKEASGGSAEVFMQLTNWFSGKLKEAIIGQSLSSGTAPTGMGSGVANLHADTLSLIIRYHADAISDSLNADFVPVVLRMLGATEDEIGHIQLSFAPERPDIASRLEAINRFVSMGGRVSERETRDLIGLGEPIKGEPILSIAAGGSSMDNPIADMVSQSAEMEGESPESDDPTNFAAKQWL